MKRILVVDDYPANILILSTLLEQLGYDCEIAETGEDAIEKAKASSYSLLLMDLHLPNIDGFTACQRIRQIEQQQGREPMPIIGLSAEVNDDTRRRSLQAGMNGVMMKHMSMDDISSLLDRYAAVAA